MLEGNALNEKMQPPSPAITAPQSGPPKAHQRWTVKNNQLVHQWRLENFFGICGPGHRNFYCLQHVHAHLVDNGAWALYKASMVSDNGDFDIHQWWDRMKDRLPTMYPYAFQTLCILHTSCDVGLSFSMWKNVRSQKQ